MITGGSAISIPEIHEFAVVLLYALYPGELGEKAVGDIICVKKSPSGKLPESFVSSIDDLPPYEDYNMINRTYKYMSVTPLYPFGFGLSYATSNYGNINAPALNLKAGQSFRINLDIQNTGSMKAEEVVQLYISKEIKNNQDPRVILKDFRRISLYPNESTNVSLDLNDKTFSI